MSHYSSENGRGIPHEKLNLPLQQGKWRRRNSTASASSVPVTPLASAKPNLDLPKANPKSSLSSFTQNVSSKQLSRPSSVLSDYQAHPASPKLLSTPKKSTPSPAVALETPLFSRGGPHYGHHPHHQHGGAAEFDATLSELHSMIEQSRHALDTMKPSPIPTTALATSPSHQHTHQDTNTTFLDHHSQAPAIGGGKLGGATTRRPPTAAPIATFTASSGSGNKKQKGLRQRVEDQFEEYMTNLDARQELFARCHVWDAIAREKEDQLRQRSRPSSPIRPASSMSAFSTATATTVVTAMRPQSVMSVPPEERPNFVGMKKREHEERRKEVNERRIQIERTQHSHYVQLSNAAVVRAMEAERQRQEEERRAIDAKRRAQWISCVGLAHLHTAFEHIVEMRRHQARVQLAMKVLCPIIMRFIAYVRRKRVKRAFAILHKHIHIFQHFFRQRRLKRSTDMVSSFLQELHSSRKILKLVKKLIRHVRIIQNAARKFARLQNRRRQLIAMQFDEAEFRVLYPPPPESKPGSRRNSTVATNQLSSPKTSSTIMPRLYTRPCFAFVGMMPKMKTIHELLATVRISKVGGGQPEQHTPAAAAAAGDSSLLFSLTEISDDLDVKIMSPTKAAGLSSGKGTRSKPGSATGARKASGSGLGKEEKPRKESVFKLYPALYSLFEQQPYSVNSLVSVVKGDEDRFLRLNRTPLRVKSLVAHKIVSLKMKELSNERNLYKMDTQMKKVDTFMQSALDLIQISTGSHAAENSGPSEPHFRHFVAPNDMEQIVKLSLAFAHDEMCECEDTVAEQIFDLDERRKALLEWANSMNSKDKKFAFVDEIFSIPHTPPPNSR